MLKAVISGKPEEVLTTVPSLGGRVRVERSGLLVPSSSDGPPDILVLTTYYPANGSEAENRLVALSGAEPKALWQSESLGKSIYEAPILANDAYAYILVDQRLLALHRTDGTSVFTATLADKVSLNLCKNCIRLIGERLLALSDDGTLQAFDARSGAPLWKARANQDSPRGLYVIDGRPAFMDEGDDRHGLMRVFDPGSGKMETVQPTCPYHSSSVDYVRWTTPLYLSPDESNFYLIFGFFESCLQRWDAEALKRTWNAKMSDSPSEDSPTLVTQDTLYQSYGKQVVAFSASDGKRVALLDDEYYQFVPLTVVGNALIVRAKNTRGTDRFELWSVDKATGKRRWTFVLGPNPPFDPPDANTGIIDVDEPVWTWHVTSKGLTLVHFKRAKDDVSHAILLETLDLESGVSSGVKEIPLGVETSILSAPEFTLWQGDMMWMSIEGKLMELDTATGEIVYRWP